MHPSARTLGTDLQIFIYFWGWNPSIHCLLLFFFFKIPRLFSQASMAKNYWLGQGLL